MRNIEKRIRKLEKQTTPDDPSIFIGDPGRYAIIGNYRLGWEDFVSMYPNHVLLVTDFADSDFLGSHSDDGRTIVGKIPPNNHKKPKKPSKRLNNG